jgi:membrane-bound serine protease (ClpP class)
MNPTVSYFMLLGGMLVAYLEFLRPGWVAPGVVGGVFATWGLSRLLVIGLNWEGAALFLLGTMLLVVHAWFWKGSRNLLRFFRWENWIGAAGVASMWWGYMRLVRIPGIDPQAAEVGTALFAIVTVPLLAMAFRARRNKTALSM